jgi:riboflavin kinase / FMN adenylyltransferase
MKAVYSVEDFHGYPRPVATIGNFDGVHLGHQQLMRDLVARARKIGGTPTVVTFHPHPLQFLEAENAPRQLQTLEQKHEVLSRLGIELAVVIPFDAALARMNARDFAVRILWERLKLQEIYVGPNFAFGNRREGSFNVLRGIGEECGFLVGRIHQVQFRGNRVSSTAVRQALIAGQAGLACRLLGRPFELSGEIVHGSATGAVLKVPTANLSTPNELIPKDGVYVTILTIEGEKFRSVTNIGVRPTITGGAGTVPVAIESHILDFDRDIYGRRAAVEFLVRLRDEKQFVGREELVKQIRKDIAKARRFFSWKEKVGTQGLPDSAIH